MENLTKIKETIGGHPVRNLVVVDEKTIIGEVANKYNGQKWEKSIFKKDIIIETYYSSNLGEGWDIDLADW